MCFLLQLKTEHNSAILKPEVSPRSSLWILKNKHNKLFPWKSVTCGMWIFWLLLYNLLMYYWKYPAQWFSKCGLQASGISFAWKFVRNTDSWVRPQTSLIKRSAIRVLRRPPQLNIEYLLCDGWCINLENHSSRAMWGKNAMQYRLNIRGGASLHNTEERSRKSWKGERRWITERLPRVWCHACQFTHLSQTTLTVSLKRKNYFPYFTIRKLRLRKCNLAI